jgi:hypothetical protein
VFSQKKKRGRRSGTAIFPPSSSRVPLTAAWSLASVNHPYGTGSELNIDGFNLNLKHYESDFLLGFSCPSFKCFKVHSCLILLPLWLILL